eukprot:2069301-Pyramimonas_sp.AAC.1
MLEYAFSTLLRALGATSHMCTKHSLQAQLAFHCLLVHCVSIASHAGRPVRSQHSAPSSGCQMKHPWAGVPTDHSSTGVCVGQKSHFAE